MLHYVGASEKAQLRPLLEARRRFRVIVALTTAGLAIALVVMAYRQRPDDSDDLCRIVVAADELPYRPLEARLSGAFAYRPFGKPMRGAARSSPIDTAPMPLLTVAAGLMQRTGASPRFAHLLAIVQLLLGRTVGASERLENVLLETTAKSEVAVALHASADAQLLNDLAAAYLSRREAPAYDALLAAEASERAWRLKQTPEIAWNRALAREALHVRAKALTAWNDFLDLETDGSWRAEAVTRIQHLSTPSEARRWIYDREQLVQPAPQSERIEALTSQYPQQMRTYGEEELLAAWAHDGNPEVLRTAGSIGEALGRTTGERLLADAVSILRIAPEQARRRLMIAHAQYSRGRDLLSHQSATAAAEQLNKAESLLSVDGDPFALRAGMYAATAEYYSGRLDTAMAHLVRLEQSATPHAERYGTLLGQVRWVIGLIEFSRGHNNESLSAYTMALASFERSQEAENQIGVVTLLAETSRYIGQERAGWLYQERALETLERLGATRRSHSVLSDAAAAAAQHELPLAALVFQDDLVSLSRSNADLVSLCDALTARSSFHAAAGDRRESEADLAEVRGNLSGISDDAMRTRTLSNLLTVEATVSRTFDPKRASIAADSAIIEMRRLGHYAPITGVELEAGRAFAQLRQTDEALQRWRDGVAECERQRSALPLQEYRRTYFEQCRALFDESITVLAHARRFSEALALAEESRARGLLDTLAPRDRSFDFHEILNVQLPTDLTVVEYMFVPDAIVAWTVDSGGVHGFFTPVSVRRFRGDLDTLWSSAASADWDVVAADLFDILIRPVAKRLRARVVFIPDGEAYRVPFAALLNRNTHKYVVEEYETSVVPSLALLVRPPISVPRGNILLIDAGAVDNVYRSDAPNLPAASREIANISTLYPTATLIRGAACFKLNVIDALQRAELAHFAGHATAGSASADPSLVLRPTGADHGLLYPSEIAALDLRRSRLIVLGACNTAGGPIGSEGPLSIARAFIAAGAQHVVATLWPIEDISASTILVAFHRYLLSDMSPSRALRGVQREAISRSTFVRDWAAFEIIDSRY